MDDVNWRPPSGGEPAMDAGDWRSQLQLDSRQKILNKIMNTLKRVLPFNGQEGVAGEHQLKQIAISFEEKSYAGATSQPDYLRRISMKMATIERKSQNTGVSSVPSNSAGNSSRPPDAGSLGMPTQPHNQGQSISMPVPANQTQTQQQLLSQNIQNNFPSAGVQNSAGLTSALPPSSGLNQTPISSLVGQSTNLQSMSGTSQNSLGNSVGQGVASNLFTNSQRTMPGRQQIVPQQQQQQPQNTQQYMQQLQQQQLMKPNFRPGNIQHMQQQQQNLLQPSQLQSSQQSAMQHSSQSMLQQHPQSVLRQQQQQPQQSSVIHQQQTPTPQQQQQQHQQPHFMEQQPNSTNLAQNQLIGQQNNVGDMQQQQQYQRLLNLQHQQQKQQQLMAQQNSLSNMHQQQLGPQINVTGLQQQQHLGSQSGNSSMQTNQHSAHMLQPKVQQHQSSSLLNQGHQSQPQASQQQLLSQIQSQPVPMQQQMSMQQHSNPLQRDMQQRIQPSGQVPGSVLHRPNVMEQQKQLYMAQRAIPETSSTSLDSTAQTGQTNGADWQEEVYQKMKAMKDMYYPELSEMYQKVASKLHQYDYLPQQPKSEQLEKLKTFKTMLERLITILQVPKSNISHSLKEKLGLYEKQIVHLINTNRPRKPVNTLQPGQLPPPHMQSMQQSQSQMTQVKPHENQMNTQLQSMNVQGSLPPMQQNNLTLQQNSMSSLSGLSTAQQNMMNSLQPSSIMDSGKGASLNSLQQVPVGSIQQANMNSLSSQNGINVLQNNINPLQSNPGILHSQQPKQQEHQLYQNQMKQQYQLKMQQQLMQKEQQQLHQQVKQQMPGQLQGHHTSQLNQIGDVNDVKIRPGMGVKTGTFQQHMSVGQRGYPHPQLKSASPYPATSSNQLLQAQSPQLSQHSSPQVEQQMLVSKAGTPLQNASSPLVVPSPSTPMAPSPMPGESEKLASLSNAGNVGHQPTASVGVQVQSLAIGTPGISASPLLAEFIGPDVTHANGLSTITGKSTVTEQPLERLIKAVKSISPKALTASISDICSVVSMNDRIAGSAPGNGSRAAVGEDLVAMTKCRLQARNFTTHDGTTNDTRKMRRYTSAMPSDVLSARGSMDESFKVLTGLETSDLESTATSRIKRPRIEANHALMEELREINRRLIDTVVDISDEDVDPSAAAAERGEGTIVKCSFDAVALSPNLKSQYASAQMSPIQPLRLLVPKNYPNCSPILLDNFHEVSKEYEDLSVKAKSRFGICLRSISEPMSLREIATTWDFCARAIISEHAQRSGGGSFSSKYGTWENCLAAT